MMVSHEDLLIPLGVLPMGLAVRVTGSSLMEKIQLKSIMMRGPTQTLTPTSTFILTPIANTQVADHDMPIPSPAPSPSYAFLKRKKTLEFSPISMSARAS